MPLLEAFLAPLLICSVDPFSGLVFVHSLFSLGFTKYECKYLCENLKYLKEKLKKIVSIITHFANDQQNSNLPELLHKGNENFEKKIKKFMGLSVPNFTNKHFSPRINHTIASKTYLHHSLDFNIFSPYLYLSQIQIMKESSKIQRKLIMQQILLVENAGNLFSDQNKVGNFIINQFKILKEESKAVETGLSGGSSKILIQKLKIQFTTESSESLNLQGEIMTKIVAIKVAKNQQKMKNFKKKKFHQINILSRLKKTNCPFIMKHYITYENGYEYQKHVMTELIEKGQPISKYIQKRNTTISLRSKIYLLIRIVNALQALQKKNIVHMDLSVNNIMVGKNLESKLIDFGEAYHEQVCGSKYKPGFTLPFSCPQQFTGCETFTSQADVFSFGVLFLYIIMFQFPFSSSSHIISVYQRGNLREKTLLIPQSMKYYGYHMQVNYLLQIISRCLHINPSQRPSLLWLSLMLKQMYFLFDYLFQDYIK